MQLGAGFSAGLVLSWAAYVVNRRVFGFLPEDAPTGGRKQHARTTPQAGFVLAAATVVWLLVQQEPALAGALALLAAAGYVDDRDKRRGGLSWRTKAVAQLTAAALIAASTTPRADLLAWLAVVGLAFVVVNAVNFVDNMDGVSASLGGLGVLLATRGEGALAVAGAVFVGFLPLNWPRPRLFLGDGGTLPLGALLAAATLRGATDPHGGVSLVALIAPTAILLLDFVQVIAARLWLGYAPWIGDRRHITHIARYAGVPGWLVAPLLVGLAVGVYWLVR
jgi:UDP-N-acetylmuramyl pentapeptide phosphotransferase/UDP-N-acetylglucosamine-1-phosphate transferase